MAISEIPAMAPATMPPIAPPLRPDDSAGSAGSAGSVGFLVPPVVGLLLPLLPPPLLPRVILGIIWELESEILVEDEDEEEEEEEERGETVLVDKELTEGPPLTLRVMEGLTVDTNCEL